MTSATATPAGRADRRSARDPASRAALGALGLVGAAAVFEQPGEPASGSEREKELLEKIGELTVERDFLARGLARHR